MQIILFIHHHRFHQHTMDPPPHPATNSIPATVSHTSYTESAESSPRSRTTETWDDRESLAVPGGGGKLRLMCSFGGHIIPRPHDKSLCYVGGDTRMVVVDRNTSLADLNSRLSKTLLHNRDFSLKYQLPNEDLDSLISVTTGEDLENMIDEFDRISSGAKSNRLRVFLFVNKRESGSSIESILDSSAKSEDWFYSSLNGSGASARGLGFEDVNSVNSLLGLENDSSLIINNGGNSRELEKSSNHDATLNPDSLMMDTSSSFGSASSSPSLANLPPIKVRVDDGGRSKVQGQRGALEEQFAQMSVSASAGCDKQDEGASASAVTSPPPIPTILLPASVVQGIPVNLGMSGPERIVPDDERSHLGVPVGYGSRQPRIQLQTQSQPQQQKPSGIFDIASPDSTSSDGSMLYQDLVAPAPSGFSRVTSSLAESSKPRVQVQPKVSEPEYMSQSQLEQQQLKQQLQQQLFPPQQQLVQPQQFIHPGTHYIQHPQNGEAVPQYYHPYPLQQHHPQHDQQQYPLYFIPPTARQPQQAYSMSIQQGTYSEPSKAIPSSHTQNPLLPSMIANPSAYNNQPQNVAPGNHEMASNIYRTPIPKAQPMVQVAPGQHQQQYIYSQVHHPPQSMPPPQNPAPPTIPNYAYEYSDPTRAQIYYTQPLAAAPTHHAQYQTMISSSPVVSDASSTQNPTDNMKHQNRSSQGQ